MRVLVVDDHSLFRDGLTSLLRAADIDVVGEASNGADAIRETLRLKPDLVLMDVNMPGMGGLDSLRSLHTSAPEIKIVMLTVSEASEDLIAAIEAGASGYLLKSLDSRTFIANLRGLERGEAAITGEMTSRLMAHIMRQAKDATRAESNPKITLTERELELLQLVARGLPNKSIARDLLISENTVKYHIKQILQKLDLKNRAEAAAYAVHKGLVKAPQEER